MLKEAYTPAALVRAYRKYCPGNQKSCITENFFNIRNVTASVPLATANISVHHECVFILFLQAAFRLFSVPPPFP